MSKAHPYGLRNEGMVTCGIFTHNVIWSDASGLPQWYLVLAYARVVTNRRVWRFREPPNMRTNFIGSVPLGFAANNYQDIVDPTGSEIWPLSIHSHVSVVVCWRLKLGSTHFRECHQKSRNLAMILKMAVFIIQSHVDGWSSCTLAFRWVRVRVIIAAPSQSIFYCTSF